MRGARYPKIQTKYHTKYCKKLKISKTCNPSIQRHIPYASQKWIQNLQFNYPKIYPKIACHYPKKYPKMQIQLSKNESKNSFSVIHKWIQKLHFNYPKSIQKYVSLSKNIFLIQNCVFLSKNIFFYPKISGLIQKYLCCVFGIHSSKSFFG